jgi:hypothetical protein
MPSFTFTSLFTNQTLTRDNFITNLRTRIDEDTADIISDTQLIEFIRQGNYDIDFRTGLLPEYATVAPDASTSYTLPTNMSKLEELIYISSDSPANYTLVLPSNLYQVQEDGYDAGTFMFYVRNGQQIEMFGSNPNTGTLRAYGSRIPTCPETGSAYIDLPDQYLELMYLWCEWKYFARRRLPDEEAIKRDLYVSMSNNVADQVRSQYSRGVTVYG